MRTITRLGLLTTVAASAFAGGVVAAGSHDSSGQLRQVAHVDDLEPSAGCDALLEWYVAKNLPEVGPFGWTQPRAYAVDDLRLGSVTPESSDSAGSSSGTVSGSVPGAYDGKANSPTGTNTQEPGVDEADTVKTSGSLLARVLPARTPSGSVELVDVSGPRARTITEWSLPQGLAARELLLVGDHLLVTAAAATAVPGPPSGPPSDVSPDMPGDLRFAPDFLRTSIVLDLDVSDPAHPRLVRRDSYSGEIEALRQYGDVVRVVTQTPRPELDWARSTSPQPDLDALTAANRELVRQTSLDDWLPSVSSTIDGTTSTHRLDCDDVLHAKHDSGHGTLAIFGYSPLAGRSSSQLALTTDSQVVYSSGDRLYVASQQWDPAGPVPQPQGGPEPWGVVAPAPGRTYLHAFSLRGTAARYLGSGDVDGMVRDRWSLDEYAGKLRVAHLGGSTAGTTVDVMALRDGALVTIGSVRGLGPDEDLKSVRWFNSFAVLVTFRQVDPLHTVDLSDPSHPRAVGELRVPGFSGYLHPLGHGLLLALGEDGTNAQAAVFDVNDLARPRRVSLVGFGPETHLSALDEPRAFTWLPSSRTAITTLQRWSSSSPNVPTRLDVSPTGRLSAQELDSLASGDTGQRAVPLADGRVAIVGQAVELLNP